MLVNSGAESEEPVVVLRPEDAVELGFSLRSDFDVIEVELASGKTQCFISRAVKSIRVFWGCLLLVRV